MVNGVHRLCCFANIGSIVFVKVANFSLELAARKIGGTVLVLKELIHVTMR